MHWAVSQIPSSFQVKDLFGAGPDFFWMPVVAKRSGRFFVARTGTLLAHLYIGGTTQQTVTVRLDGSKLDVGL